MAKKPVAEGEPLPTRVKKQHPKFLTAAQEKAWEIYQNNQVIFLVGVAGTGKTHLSMAFAVQEIVGNQKSKIIISRPIVEAGENLGFLPGDLNEKVAPYMTPFYNCLDRICGKEGTATREKIDKRIEVAPLAYMRGATYHDSVCILDEAQNCTRSQIKLFLSRLGENSKMIITGDPYQSDLGVTPDITSIVNDLKDVPGIGHVLFEEKEIVRNPLIGEILKKI